MIMGSAFHAMILEPEIYKRDYKYIPDLNRRLKEHREMIKANEEQGITILDFDDFVALQLMKDAIVLNPIAQSLLSKGVAEQAFFWIDDETGIECKCKPDFLNEAGIVVDLKKTVDAGKDFQRHVLDYGYHIQAAFYLDGLRANGKDVTDFVFIAVESEAPYDVVIYKISDEYVHYGREQYKKALQMVKEANETGARKGYSDTLETLYMPKWLKKGIEL